MTNNHRDDGPLQDAIVSYISRSSLTGASKVGKKDIHKHIQSSFNGEWSKKDVKRALKRLVKQAKIQKESKQFFLTKPIANNDTNSEDASERNNDLSEHGQQFLVPIAQRMRHQQHSQKPILSDNGFTLFANDDKQRRESVQPLPVDLDEEIRRLEAELAADSASDDNDNDDDDTVPTEGDDDDHKSHSPSNTNDMNSSGVICLSETANERIEPLPPSAMPQISRKSTTDLTKEHRKRKSRNKHEHTINEGLQHAVRDILANYKTRSEVEQTPWYCRICQHQADNESEYVSHRESAFHKTAVSEHKKKTYCRMCRKQMTSVVQFQEHLRSRPHRELLSVKRAQQQQGRGGLHGRGGSGRGRGRGADGWGGGRGSSLRQWC